MIVIVKELYPCSSKLQQNHTRRCKHASDENDEEYIRRALQLGANEIRGYKEKAEYMKKLNELEVDRVSKIKAKTVNNNK